MARKKVERKKYIAGRRMVVGGVVYNPGDTADLVGVSDAYIAHLIGRQFWAPTEGLESLDDEMYLLVREAQD